MNISIIVGGRFHAFNLAEQLNKQHYLKQLITSYPKFYVNKNFKIKSSKIKSIYLKEVIQRSYLNKIFDLNDFLTEYFDKKAKSILEFKDIDILIGWSSFSYHSFLKAQNEKCIKILERGSTHIDFQNNILKEEYSFHNLKPKLISNYIIQKEKKEYELADYIMVPTKFAKKTFLDKGFSNEKILINPYGVDIDEFKEENTRKKSESKFRIIYTGAVSVRKGVLYLLECFNKLNLENSELLIIGNIEKELKSKLKKFELNKKIIFKNSVKQSELKHYYNLSDIFITCSVEEGLSMVQLQAMSCGLPLICTINSGGEEIVDNGVNGFIIPIRDHEKLEEKILKFYYNRELCIEMGKKAKIRVNKQFSWDLYGKNAISIYQSLLKK